MASKSGLETDYLVVGAGAAGMAFTDALIEHSKADVIIVDKRQAPGGHWNDAYPFVRLHQPAMYYGVNSTQLGADTIDRGGLNDGSYVQASAPEIVAYYDHVMRYRLVASGRVRYFPMTEHVPDGRLVSLLTADCREVKVRRAVVDARYLEPSVPSRTPPPFSVDDGVRCVPVGDIVRSLQKTDRYVLIGGGKTAMDACQWLLTNGVPPEAITWIRPREAWLQNRYFAQCGSLVGQLIEGLAGQMEAAAHATSVDNLFARLAEKNLFLRIDENTTPTMYKGPTLSLAELALLRQVRNVVRLGHVLHVRPDAVELEKGRLPTSANTLHVHCSSPGLNLSPALPVFTEGRITLQSIRFPGLVPFNAALTAYIEATRHDSAEKNKLCPPYRQPDVPVDWVRGTLSSMAAERAWSQQSDVALWLERSRLNASRGLAHLRDSPEVKQAMARFASSVGPALANLRRLATGHEHDVTHA